ncbi:helix-turn-helix domain-containing protein [Pseudomonas luteola]
MNSLPTESSLLSLKRGLTVADMRAAENLKAIWKDYRVRYYLQHGETMTQKKAAALINNWTQSNLSQYLNGIVPIGLKAAQLMADLFGCNVSDIRPDYVDTAVLEENEQLKSMLSKVLTALNQLQAGETDLQQVHLMAKQIQEHVPATELASA